MFAALTALHVIVAISLVLVVLLQTGRGAELGAAFGGMGQATSGRGKSTFISKFTTAIAIIFMLTSLSLAFLTRERPQSSLLQGNQPVQQAPAPATPPAPAQPSQSPTQSSKAPTQPSAPSR